MPVQQAMSSFAKKLGARVAQANDEHRDKPIDTGNRRLPPGIRDGVAKLSTAYTKEYEDDKNGPGTKGNVFFRASAIVVSPVEHNGQKVSGQVTSVVIPLCDMPAKGQRKAVSFSENWFEFQNWFKLLGVAPCLETPQTDPTGQRTEAYFMAAIKMLTDPNRTKTNPVYVSFSTRGWTPPATPQQPKPEEMTFETWHGLAQYNGHVDPGAGVGGSDPTLSSTQPPPMSAPPQTATHGAAAPPPITPPPQQYQPPQEPADQADVVAALVEVAMGDPEGATDEGRAASAQLEEMAWAVGWSKEQTASAMDWAGVGDMVLNPPSANVSTQATPAAPPQAATSTVSVAQKFMFAKRTKEGAKLKNNKGEEFPAQEVEVLTVNDATKTCTLKTCKDGKPVVDIRSKQPVDVKFEWLEPWTH